MKPGHAAYPSGFLGVRHEDHSRNDGEEMGEALGASEVAEAASSRLALMPVDQQLVQSACAEASRR